MSQTSASATLNVGKAMRFQLRSFLRLVVLCSLLFGLATILRPPYTNYTAQRFQAYLESQTGIQLYRYPPGGDYTGEVELWGNDGRLCKYQVQKGEWHGRQREFFPDGSVKREYEYVHGQRQGTWIDYLADGKIKWIRQYKMGQPWNGVCRIEEGKVCRGEYRNDQKWNGCWYDPIDPGNPRGEYYVDGKRVDRNKYLRQHNIDTERVDVFNLSLVDDFQHDALLAMPETMN